VLITLIVWNNYQLDKTFYNSLQGMWIAPDSFCTASDIDGMMVYIGPNISASKSTHKGYLLMYSDNTVAIAKAITIEFNLDWPKLYINNSLVSKAATIKSQNSEESLEDIMPEDQTISINLSKGFMEWTAWDPDVKDYRKYAEFYRDNISSSFEKIEI